MKNGDKELTVYDSGEIEEGKFEIWDGSTVECPEFKNENNVWNWYIYKPSQLKFLANFENDENADGINIPESLTSIVEEAGYNASEITMTTDSTIYLMNNLDLGARQTNGTKTSGTDWIPIGIDTSKVFHKLGMFKGNNHIIKGVYVNRTQPYNGIFGSSNTIENLTIKDSYIQGGGGTGGIVGVLAGGTLENCHNNNSTIILDIDSHRNVGGIVGSSSITGIVIKNCSNTGKVIGKGEYAGGIIGAVLSTIEVSECINNGIIEGNMEYTGGIVGYCSGEIIKCTNNGRIIGKGEYTGGILGFGYGDTLTSECTNNGEVTGNNVGIGGIAGYLENEYSLSKCINNGTINGKINSLGGIVGLLRNGTVSECINKGTVKGEAIGIGGIAGLVGLGNTNGILKNCYNLGRVILEKNAQAFVGGIAGCIRRGEVKYNYSIGEIEIEGTGKIHIGGAIGYNEGTQSNNYYLTGKSNYTFDSNEGEGKDSTYMKSNEFLTNLNEGQNPVLWEFRTGENSGYPVLKK